MSSVTIFGEHEPTTLAQLPSLAADTAWRAALGQTRFDGILEASMEAAPDVAWELALMAGDPARARSLASGTSDDDFLGVLVIS